MKQKNKPSPAAGEFLFEIDSEPLDECVTALGGVPLLVRAARSLDVPGRVQRHVQVKQRQRGFDEASYVESFLVLNAVGGDCLEDFDQLREDAGPEMLSHAVPSAEAARKSVSVSRRRSSNSYGRITNLLMPLIVYAMFRSIASSSGY